MNQNSVFISYRRALSKHLARSIYQDLKLHGWDVFLDVNTIDSGDFDRIILNQIAARAHFILLISPGSLERCANPGDWVLREIEEAVRLNRNIVPIIEEGADFEREMGYLPSELRAIVSKKSALPLPHFFFDAAVEMLRTRFLKAPEYIQVTETPASERAEVQRRLQQVEAETHSKPTSLSLMPAPFEWIEIPGGRGTIKTDESGVTLQIPDQRYWISKYPVTNAQFAKFVEAGGYHERKWWTDTGWQQCQKDGWTEPRYCDSEWNGMEQPVVGVSWYEAVAFCLWLSDVTGERIMLPTEDQWQYAAQGDDGRAYPWGKNWDATRCNNNVDNKGIGETTPVRQYEGKGDSPFGVVDMAGNVWEWCLTDYDNKSNNINDTSTLCVLRGGSWHDDDSDLFRCDIRFGVNPLYWDDLWGFRVSRS